MCADHTRETTENPEALSPLSQALEELGFVEYSNATQLEKILQEGLHSTQFKTLCSDLIKPILILSSEQLDVQINPHSLVTNKKPEEFANLLKTSLRTLGYSQTENALQSFESRLEMIEFLVSQLQMYRVLTSLKMNSSNEDEEDTELLELGERLYVSNRPQRELTCEEKVQQMCQILELPTQTDMLQSLRAIQQRIQELVTKLPQEYIGKSLWQGQLTPQHIKTLEEINAALKEEYRGRQEVLLKRLDVTLQTFLWSEKANENKEEMKKIVETWRQRIISREPPNFTIFDVIAAQDDLIQIRKTSYKPPSLLSKTEETLKKIVIGAVPDRGGRVGNLRRVDPSMPKFQPRVVTNEEINRGAPQRPQKPASKKQRVQGGWTRTQEQKGRGSGSRGGWRGGPRR